jgi:hypothetical protein
MAGVPTHHVALTVKPEGLSPFRPLLQSGVRVSCRVGVTLEELLVQEWGIAADYVATRITTLFLNSRAVDDITTSVVHGGATIALSGAMPGLVGATMRRGGYYAAMRGAMSYTGEDDTADGGIDRVRVKLFNLLLGELGPGFLARGVIMTAAELGALITDGDFLPEYFTDLPCLDGRQLSPDALATALAPSGGEDLLLTVQFEDSL